MHLHFALCLDEIAPHFIIVQAYITLLMQFLSTQQLRQLTETTRKREGEKMRLTLLAL